MMQPPTEARYASPVYRWANGEMIGPRTVDASEDSQEELVVKRDDRQYGDPDLRVVRTTDSDTDRYRFRITDDDLGYVSFGEDPDDLPVDVQHAVHAFGYAFTDHNPVSEWLQYRFEIDEINNRVQAIRESVDGRPILETLFDDAHRSLGMLGVECLAQHSLPEGDLDQLAEVEDVTGEFADDFRERLDAPVDRALRVEGNGGVVMHEREQGSETYLLADLLFGSGAARYSFRTLSDDRLVFTGSGGVPFAILYELHGSGYEFVNIDSVAEAETPLETFERAAALAVEVMDADSVDEQRSVGDVVYSICETVAVALKMADIDGDGFDREASNLFEQYGINTGDKVPSGVAAEMVWEIVSRVSHQAREDVLDYLETTPAFDDRFDGKTIDEVYGETEELW